MNLATLSPKNLLLHSVNNQLTVVIAQAELLATELNTEQDQVRCLEIKQAAAKINRLLQAFMAESQRPRP